MGRTYARIVRCPSSGRTGRNRRPERRLPSGQPTTSAPPPTRARPVARRGSGRWAHRRHRRRSPRRAVPGRVRRRRGGLVEKPLATTSPTPSRSSPRRRRRGDRCWSVTSSVSTPATPAPRDGPPGAIGEPLTIYARRLNGIAAQDRLRGVARLPLFLGVHDYDIVRWVAGSEVTEVVARARTGFWRGWATSRTPASPC